MPTAILSILLAIVASVTPAMAGALRIDVTGLRSQAGFVRVAVCPRESFTEPTCPHVGSAPAARPEVIIPDLPDGIYAVQAFHDEDGDGTIDRSGWRLSEGIAFSNDAPMRFGPPRFRDAAVRFTGSGRLTLNMRYDR